MRDSQTNQEAGKQSAEQVAKTLDEIRDNLVDKMPVGKVDAWQLIKVIGNHVKELDEYIEHQSTQLAAATPVKGEYIAVPVSNPNAELAEGYYYDVNKNTFQLIRAKAAPKGDDVKSPEEILHKHTGGRDYTIPTLKLAILEYANQFAAPQAVKWVSIEDDVPKESGEVLGCMKDTLSIYVCFYKKSRNLFQVWGAGRDPITDMKVTHWMPMPKPPIEWSTDKNETNANRE